MKRTFLAAALLATSCLVGGAASAQTAIQSFSGGSRFPAYSNDETVGFTFATTAALTVSNVGWYVENGTALAASHQVGIWSDAGVLLASATVSAGAPTSGGFRYASLTAPLSLGVGNYFIGGRDTAEDGDFYVTSVSNLVTGSGITFLGSAVSPEGSGFAFPGAVNALTTGGRFGANFQYSLDAIGGAVPEPATWGMMLLGFGATGFAMRRRAKVRATVSFA